MVVADLHVHTTNSDGTMELAAVPATAVRAGLAAVAITDHDRLHPALASPVTDLDGVTLIHGIELRVDPRDRGLDERVDLLGYAVERTDRLDTLVEHLQQDRVERARRIVDCVEARLDVSLDIEPQAGTGRPHIARAIEAATDHSYQWAFDELIGDDGPCYVARDVPSFAEGRDVLAEASRVVGLAHPFRYDDPAGALALCADLDAVERYYPYGRPVDDARLDRAIERHDLLATGGSDAHEDRLGEAGLERREYRTFRAAL